MTAEETALRITHHICAGLPFTANQPEVQRGMHYENRVIDAVSREDLRTLLQLYISHATSANMHAAVQLIFIRVLNIVAEEAAA